MVIGFRPYRDAGMASARDWSCTADSHKPASIGSSTNFRLSSDMSSELPDDMPTPPPPAAAVDAAGEEEEEIQWEEEEEEVIEMESGAAMPAAAPTTTIAGNSEGAAPAVAAAPAAGSSASAAPADAAAPSSTASVSHLRYLLRPYGPLDLSLALTVIPSLVPVPPQSLYPAQIRGGPGGAAAAAAAAAAMHARNNSSNYLDSNPNRKRALEPDSHASADTFWNQVKPLRELPLLRIAARTGSASAATLYDPARVAQSLTVAAASAPALVDTHLSDAQTLAHIASVESFLSSSKFSPAGTATATATEHFRRLWNAHEYFDPYRILTHPQPTDQPPSAHPAPTVDAPATLARFAAALSRAADRRPVPLHLSPSLSFCCSHVLLALSELDLLHGVVTSSRQREVDQIALALRAPPAPKEMFLTFVDLSGSEGAASEFVLWKRRVCNLRAKGWAFDLTATGAPANWSAQWINATAREQAKNFDVFHAPVAGAASSSASASTATMPHVRLRAMSEENVQTFMRMIDMQTKGVGVQLALAVSYASATVGGDAVRLHQPSLSFRLAAALLYPTLLFQVDTALRTLCKGGTLLLQLYETHTPFTLSVLYTLFRCFEYCALHQVAATVGYGSGQW